MLPSGEVILLDEDELESALIDGVITKEDFDLAYTQANQIMSGIAKDISYLSEMSYKDLKFFKIQLYEDEIR